MSSINVLLVDCMLYMRDVEDDSFDLAIVDPPYFNGPDKLGYYGKGSRSVTGVRRPDYEAKDWDVPGEDYFRELFRISKHQIIWGCNHYAGYIPHVGRIVWNKVNQSSSFSDAEIASCSLHDSTRMFDFMWNGMCQGKSISEGRVMQGNKKLNEKRIHPTQKPVILYDWLLREYAKPGMRIFDSHHGSGSLSISADKYGCDLVACEIDSSMYVKQQKRYANYKAQLRLF